MTSDSSEVTSSAAWLNANVQAPADANHNISSSPIYALHNISDSLFNSFYFSNLAMIYSYATIYFLISPNNKTINSLNTRRFKRDHVHAFTQLHYHFLFRFFCTCLRAGLAGSWRHLLNSKMILFDNYTTFSFWISWFPLKIILC